MSELAGKVAVVTGGNSGIGMAGASAFAAEGADVVILGRRQDAVDAAVASLGGRATGLVGDVADLETHDRLADFIRTRFGGIDIYVANAGVNVLKPTEAVTVEDYDTQFAINTRSIFFGVQKIAPLIRNGGSIVLTSSIAAGKVLDGHTVYAGTKAAIEAFARNWAVEFKDRRIRVNVLSPGPVETPILGKMGLPEEMRAGFGAHMAGRVPLGRIGQPAELARAMLFLASDASSFVTGASLPVDGGISLT